jgi:WD40 repeat protein
VLVIEGGTLKLIRLETGELLGRQDGFLSRTWQAAASADRLAAYRGDPWARDVSLLLWDRGTLQEISNTAQSNVESLSGGLFFTLDGSRLISYTQNSRALKYWKASDGTLDREMAFDGALSTACISADGQVLAAGLGSKLEVWPAAGGQPTMSVYADGTIDSLSLSADGGRVATGGTFEVVVLDVPTNTTLMGFINSVMSTTGERARYPVLSPNGKFAAFLFSGKKGNTIKLYNPDTGKMLWSTPLGSHFDMMRFSPDGSMMAVNDSMEGLVFLDVFKGKPLFTLDYWPMDFSFSADGNLIVTASSDGTLRGWGVQ